MDSLATCSQRRAGKDGRYDTGKGQLVVDGVSTVRSNFVPERRCEEKTRGEVRHLQRTADMMMMYDGKKETEGGK